MTTLYDSIVIGAGHNGLTAAAYLTKAGQRVLVLERRPVVGGSVVTEELWPGFRVDTVQHRGQLAADVVRDLNLAQHGLQMLHTHSGLFAPQPEGGALWLTPGRAVDSIARFSKTDAQKWPDFCALLLKVAGFLNEAYALTMPRLPQPNVAEAPALAQLGLKLRGLGKRDMMEAIRVLPMSLDELFSEWFESDALKGALGALGVHGLTQGPLSAGTAYLLLHYWTLQNGPFRLTAKGGLGAISQALAKAAAALGAEIRTGVEAAQILVDDGRATGVRLASGEELRARRVVSATDPKRTFLQLVGPLELDPHFVHAVQCIKMRGSFAKVHFALNGLPHFPAAPDAAALGSTIIIAPSLPYLERAYDAAKYGGLSEQPYLEVTLPSLNDPSLAPAGQHVMSVHMQYAAYRGETGDWRAEIERRVIETLSVYAPNLRSLISHSHVLTPHDLEREYGLTEGNLHHGELMLDQFLFMRPVPGWAHYRTPIDGLWLCGPGTHPGGGVSGMPGRNAAREILKEKQV
jgi:phytoene dehydrogenase-like protein